MMRSLLSGRTHRTVVLMWTMNSSERHGTQCIAVTSSGGPWPRHMTAARPSMPTIKAWKGSWGSVNNLLGVKDVIFYMLLSARGGKKKKVWAEIEHNVCMLSSPLLSQYCSLTYATTLKALLFYLSTILPFIYYHQAHCMNTHCHIPGGVQ